MKRIASILVLLALLLSLTACEGITINVNIGGSETTGAAGGTTEAPIPEDTTIPPVTDTQPQDTTEPGDRDTVLPIIPSTQPPVQAPDSVEALWDRLSGCWMVDNRFVYFTYGSEGPAFWSGTWENPMPYRRDPAAVTSLTNLGQGLYTLSITYPPVSGDAADSQDLQSIRYTIGLDIAGLDSGIVRVEAPEDQWRSYTFGGYSYDDAYDASHNVQHATSGEMVEFWQWLTGYWNSDDGHFVCFDQKDSTSLIFMQGIWNSGTRGWADFEKAMSGAMDLPTEFVVYYPPVSNELHGDLPGEYLYVSVDWMDVETHRKIRVRLGEKGMWMTYTFAGYTEADAYPY